MKVFISHSSSDRWIARKVSDDIQATGAETFLDEKDLVAGDSIDGTISSHLESCDHFLVLLTTSSLQSHWVLIEIGGALALGKIIVAVLVYVSPNELPNPVSRFLSIDLNDFDRYCRQLKERNTKSDLPIAGPKHRRPKQKINKFAIGSMVLLPTSPMPRVKSVMWNPVGAMDQYCGRQAKVIGTYSDYAARLDIDAGQFVWPFQWLKRARHPKGAA
jgi:hypothetical protein